jgi:transposase-like protein
MPFPAPASGMVNIMITITGISDRDQLEWVIAINGIRRVRRFRDVRGKALSTEQMEIARLKAELSRVRMERDILKKATAYFARESR